MLRIAVITAAALIGAAVSASAGDQGDPKQECGVSTPEMVDCANAEAAQWDKRMTIAYQLMLKAGSPEQRKQLRVAQRIKQRQQRQARNGLDDAGHAQQAAA